MPTGTNLIDRALDYADMTGSAFPVAARNLDIINDGLSELHYALANAENADWFNSSVQIAVVKDTGAYALPNGTLYSNAKKFYKALKVYLREGSRRYKLRSFERGEIDGFEVAPLNAGTIDLFYIPEFVALATAGASIDTAYPSGWEDYVALHLAVRLLLRESSFDKASAYAQERDRKLQHILRGITPRDIGTPGHIQDVTNRWSGSVWRPGWPNKDYMYRIEGANLVVLEASVI